jgi:hypothetical protein
MSDDEVLRHKNKQLRDALEGLLMEWDKLTRYGSPMAKGANERVTAARKLLDDTHRKAWRELEAIMPLMISQRDDGTGSANVLTKPNKDELWAAIRGRDEKINKLVKELAASERARVIAVAVQQEVTPQSDTGDDLVGRLRNREGFVLEGPRRLMMACEEAARTIETKDAEIVRLRAELAEWVRAAEEVTGAGA